MYPRVNKKIIICFLLVIAGYFVVRLETHKYVFSARINNASPVEILEYVSDFNNMKILIPNIKFFKIISESGNNDNWKYGVYYEENLSHLPFFTNFAWADYETKKISENEYVIYSKHKTCFLLSLFCIRTNAVFEIERIENSSDSTYTETIKYECPSILKSLCEDEIMVQRVRMKEVLIKEFEKRARNE